MKFQEKRILNYPIEKLYETVGEVTSYPTFLPSCQEAKIIEKKGDISIIDLTIGYGPFCETFRSEVHFIPLEKISVNCVSGPFKFLKNSWEFKAVSPHETEVEFFIEFEFKSKLFQKMIEKAFKKGAGQVIKAFEERLKEDF